MKYYFSAFKNYAKSDGRATRKEYWWFILFHYTVIFVLSFLDGFMGFYSEDIPLDYGYLTLIYLFASACPTICLQVRRLHDVGKSGSWWWLKNVPIISFYMIYLNCKASDPKINAYGAPSNFETTTVRDQEEKTDLDIDKMSPQEAAEYLFAEQLGEKYISKVVQSENNKTKVKYCSQCGSPIDSLSKKCTGCGKQHFKGFRFTKFSVTIIVLILVIATLSTLCVLQYINIQKVKDKTSTSETLTTSSNVVTMKVAIEADFVPYSWIEGGNYYGLHIDIAKEIAKRTEKNVSFVVVDFDDMISGVDSGLYDMAFGLEKTPEREKIVAFTDEYYDGMCAIYHTEGENPSFSEWTEYVKILEDIKEDGTLRNLLSKYNLS